MGAVLDNIFTLPFSEYQIAAKLQDIFKKKVYSIAIPMSRQQKGFDLILYNMNSKKSLTFQVKSSKWYTGRIPKRKVNTPYVENWFWLNVFKLEKGRGIIGISFFWRVGQVSIQPPKLPRPVVRNDKT
ncbi:MAG: hypothetical protein N2692_03045 [Patescibacteria group bacterium]|nr:hypothetical protein [Patescibacteria group bacterium]